MHVPLTVPLSILHFTITPPAAVIQTDTPLNRKGFTSELSLCLVQLKNPIFMHE